MPVKNGVGRTDTIFPSITKKYYWIHLIIRRKTSKW